MSAPQPPADGPSRGDTAPDAAGPTPGPGGNDAGSPTYDFHGEKLDFDPYRFGRPEPTAPTWSPTPAGAPATDPTRPPTPGERWQPGQDGGPPPVRPGDYWGGAGAHRGTFPPAGYVPPTGEDRPGGGDDRTGIDLSKPHDTAGGSAPPPGYPSGPPAGSAYPPPAPPGSQHAPYAAPGAYPGPPTGSTGGRNGLAVAGLVVGIVGCLLAITSWPGILVGLVGLGLAISGLVRARRGATGKGLAIAGVVVSIVAVVASTVLLVLVLSRIDFDCVVNANGDTSQAQECIR